MFSSNRKCAICDCNFTPSGNSPVQRYCMRTGCEKFNLQQEKVHTKTDSSPRICREVQVENTANCRATMLSRDGEKTEETRFVHDSGDSNPNLSGTFGFSVSEKRRKKCLKEPLTTDESTLEPIDSRKPKCYITLPIELLGNDHDVDILRDSLLVREASGLHKISPHSHRKRFTGPRRHHHKRQIVLERVICIPGNDSWKRYVKDSQNEEDRLHEVRSRREKSGKLQQRIEKAPNVREMTEAERQFVKIHKSPSFPNLSSDHRKVDSNRSNRSIEKRRFNSSPRTIGKNASTTTCDTNPNTWKNESKREELSQILKQFLDKVLDAMENGQAMHGDECANDIKESASKTLTELCFEHHPTDVTNKLPGKSAQVFQESKNHCEEKLDSFNGIQQTETDAKPSAELRSACNHEKRRSTTSISLPKATSKTELPEAIQKYDSETEKELSSKAFDFQPQEKSLNRCRELSGKCKSADTITGDRVNALCRGFHSNLPSSEESLMVKTKNLLEQSKARFGSMGLKFSGEGMTEIKARSSSENWSTLSDEEEGLPVPKAPESLRMFSTRSKEGPRFWISEIRVNPGDNLYLSGTFQKSLSTVNSLPSNYCQFTLDLWKIQSPSPKSFAKDERVFFVEPVFQERKIVVGSEVDQNWRQETASGKCFPFEEGTFFKFVLHFKRDGLILKWFGVNGKGQTDCKYLCPLEEITHFRVFNCKHIQSALKFF